VRCRKLLIALSLVTGSLVVSLLLGEIGLRLLGHRGAPHAALANTRPVDDPVLDWRYVPGSHYVLGNVAYRYNGAGFRDVEHGVEAAPGTRRLLVLGDSVTEALGVDWGSSFSQRVQRALGRGWEVVTLAAGGLNTPQEVHLLEREGLQYRPELLVLNFVLNDADFYTSYRAAQRYLDRKDSTIGLLNLPVSPEFKRLLKSSALVYFVKERVEHLRGRLLGADERDYFTALWAGDGNRQKVRQGFDRLAAVAQDRSLTVVVIIWPLITDYRRYGFDAVHRWVRHESERRGFSVVDLLPDFARHPYRELQLTAEDNVHPNARGHGLAAEAFLRWHRTTTRPAAAVSEASPS
jgi:lysophospholipase L1-like esterase